MVMVTRKETSEGMKASAKGLGLKVGSVPDPEKRSIFGPVYF